MIQEKKCFFKDTQCSYDSTDPKFEKEVAFIIGSTSPEFSTDIKTIIKTLDKHDYYGFFASEEIDLNSQIFCKKICRNIRYSAFCIVLYNSPVNPIISRFPPEESIKKEFTSFPNYKDILKPSSNVWFEYGLTVGVRDRKNIIPIFKKKSPDSRPFDVQGLESISYENQIELFEKLDNILTTSKWIVDYKPELKLEAIKADIQKYAGTQNRFNLKKLFNRLCAHIPSFVSMFEENRIEDFKESLKSIHWLYTQYDNRSYSNPRILADTAYIFTNVLGSIIIKMQKWRFIKPIFEMIYYDKSSRTHYPILLHEKVHYDFFPLLIHLENYIEEFEVFKDYPDLDLDYYLLNLLFSFHRFSQNSTNRCLPYFLYPYADYFRWFFDLIYIQKKYSIIEEIFGEKKLIHFSNFILEKPFNNWMRNDNIIMFNIERDFAGQLFEEIKSKSSNIHTVGDLNDLFPD